MSSSIPAALDWLVPGIRALDEVGDMRAVVADGWPAERGDTLIAIGVTPEEDESGITATYAELSRMEVEDVEVPCIIAVRRVRSDPSAGASVARTDAYALLDAIRDLVAGDRRLGGAVRPGLPARIGRWQMSQTSDARQAGEGRVCEIRWVISWQHRG